MSTSNDITPLKDDHEPSPEVLQYYTPRRVGHLTSPSRSSSKLLLEILGSHRRSPNKRGILNTYKTESREISPIKTPNGRAGLSSPKKRSLPDLDKSARKRALKTTVSSRLMYEEYEEDTDIDEQDQRLARRIIKESRKAVTNDSDQDDEDFDSEEDYVRDYGSDVEFEEDISEKTKKYTRKARSFESKITTKSTEATSKKIGRPKTRESTPDGSPKKVGRPRTREVKQKKRVGRPSKSDVVIGKVKSIFQMDDDKFFHENKITYSESNTSSPIKNSDTLKSVNFDNTGESTYSLVPIVSGVTEMPIENTEHEEDNEKRFVPLPIPKLDESGHIMDQEYVEKYFPDSNIEAKYKGKLADERAFFLEGSEGYFEQHNTRVKSSANSLQQLAPKLEYDEFIPFVMLSKLLLGEERKNLIHLHKALYHQWCFELTQGFNLNFYGVGSKIDLILDFIENYLIDWYKETIDDVLPLILVINGYNPATKLKKIVLDIASALITPSKKKSHKVKFPKHVSECIPFLVEHMNKNRSKSNSAFVKPKLILTFHNIDGESLRDEKTQNLLSQLCSLPEVWLISSVDNINVSLLWDLFRLKNFNFIWHDLTTYHPYNVEVTFKDILSMGKSKKFVGNKGAKYVLASLTIKARQLYKILLIKQIDLMNDAASTKAGRVGLRGNIKLAVRFKEFFEACKDEFVTFNEISFRTLLGEFLEHKMCTLTKDESGTEVVFVPFSFDELKQLLHEVYEVSQNGSK